MPGPDLPMEHTGVPAALPNILFIFMRLILWSHRHDKTRRSLFCFKKKPPVCVLQPTANASNAPSGLQGRSCSSGGTHSQKQLAAPPPTWQIAIWEAHTACPVQQPAQEGGCRPADRRPPQISRAFHRAQICPNPAYFMDYIIHPFPWKCNNSFLLLHLSLGSALAFFLLF